MKKSIILMVAPALLCASGLWANEQLNQQLRSAAAAGDVTQVEHLLDRGADIEARDDYGNTALMYASVGGKAAVVELLLDRSAEIDARRGPGLRTALMHASRNGEAAVVELLLDRGADIEARDYMYGQTTLMCASESGEAAVVELLLDRGADIEARARDGDTALEVAYNEGHRDVMNVLRAAGATR